MIATLVVASLTAAQPDAAASAPARVSSPALRPAAPAPLAAVSVAFSASVTRPAAAAASSSALSLSSPLSASRSACIAGPTPSNAPARVSAARWR